jgi:glyoxylase-like metal-dependent hydrolase (beta-lactamase superfamily II)
MVAVVRTFTTGWLTTDRAGLIEGGEGRVRIPVLSHLVEHPNGRVVFDTGLHHDLRTDPAARLGFLAQLFDVELAAGTAVDERVEALAGGVDLVVNSHLHFDHCGGNAHLGDVPVVVQRREWAAHGGDPTAGYLEADVEVGQDVRLVDGEHDVFGDGAVVCVPTPGHTAGHQSLRVRTADGEVVLAGDACYFRESLATGRLPLFGFDADEQHRSLEVLRSLERSGSRLVFGHDPDQVPDDAVVSWGAG